AAVRPTVGVDQPLVLEAEAGEHPGRGRIRDIRDAHEASQPERSVGRREAQPPRLGREPVPPPVPGQRVAELDSVRGDLEARIAYQSTGPAFDHGPEREAVPGLV